MIRLKTFLCYTWALTAIPIVLATFMGMNFWAEKLVAITGLEVSPWCTGGQVAHTIKHNQYQTLIHRPVFDGLIKERRKGFVQIKWAPNESVLPKHIDEEIDFDADGKNDFRIKLNTETNETELQKFNKEVVSLGEVLVVGSGRILRVELKRNSN